MQKRAAVAAVVLVLALFPNLVSVLLPLVAVLSWAVGQPLLAGVAVGAVFFAGRRRTVPKQSAAPVTKSAVAA
ncbi:hypothetical protein EAO72_41450 [Streptomyces sp. or43]|nr:hypothetical protein EAO72_41450 [Streptomyces sp. or43]